MKSKNARKIEYVDPQSSIRLVPTPGHDKRNLVLVKALALFFAVGVIHFEYRENRTGNAHSSLGQGAIIGGRAGVQAGTSDEKR